MPEDSGTTTQRVLELLSLFQTHRHWPGAELARRLGVTGRTVRRDVERLRDLGYEVSAARGVTGGYRLESGSQLPPLLLTDDEAVTTAIGLRLAATHGLADGELTTLSALAKFEQILPAPLRRRVNALASVLDPVSPGAGAVSPELLGALALVCRDRERIRFRYIAADGTPSSRWAEPAAVVVQRQSWFLVCWDLERADWRTFRVDRMADLIGTGQRFESRSLPAATAAEYVTRSMRALHRRYRADVVMELPIADAQRHFGRWGSRAVAVDSGHTSWPIEGENLYQLTAALAWIPAGVRFEIHADNDVLAHVTEWAKRLSGGVGGP